MKNAIYKFWSKLLDIIGDIKLYKFPMFVVYDPTFFEMTGEKISKAISVMEPGDIVLRGYNMYLDSHFIDGDYSHGSICVSKDSIVHAISPDVCSIHPIEFMECDRIAILRPKDKSKIANALTTANELIGTPYDFNFNSGDQQEVYCFELVAKCYPEMNI
jgi:uncharacterized protein YycO